MFGHSGTAKQAPATNKPSNYNRSLWLAVFAALVIRLTAVAILYPDQLNPRRDHWPFGYEAGRIAQSIALGKGFGNPLFTDSGPTAWMAPVYPYLVAGVFQLFGIYSKASAIALLSLNSLFSALTCLPVFFIARKGGSQLVALWAAWSWALFPYSIYFATDWVWEICLTTLLFSVLFLYALHLESSSGVLLWAGFGLLWGLAALTNPVVLSVLPFLGYWIFLRLRHKQERWLRPAMAATFVFVVAVAPWFLRNYRTFHRFVPFRDNLGLELHVGNNGDTSHWAPDSAHPSTNESELEEFNRLGEIGYMDQKRSQALHFIRSHPASFAWVTFRRIVYMWTGYWSFDQRYLAGESFDFGNIPFRTSLTILALAGLRCAFQRRLALASPCALVLLTFPLVYYITTPQWHYRHAIDPLIVILAVYAAMRSRIAVPAQ
jgi:4-amino-4-deoxy-L-arabinose transferase-like glycosyltransferase